MAMLQNASENRDNQLIDALKLFGWNAKEDKKTLCRVGEHYNFHPKMSFLCLNGNDRINVFSLKNCFIDGLPTDFFNLLLQNIEKAKSPQKIVEKIDFVFSQPMDILYRSPNWKCSKEECHLSATIGQEPGMRYDLKLICPSENHKDHNKFTQLSLVKRSAIKQMLGQGLRAFTGILGTNPEPVVRGPNFVHYADLEGERVKNAAEHQNAAPPVVTNEQEEMAAGPMNPPLDGQPEIRRVLSPQNAPPGYSKVVEELKEREGLTAMK